MDSLRAHSLGPLGPLPLANSFRHFPSGSSSVKVFDRVSPYQPSTTNYQPTLCLRASVADDWLRVDRQAALIHTARPSMHWVVASLVAAFFLGIYELCTKHAVHKNAVLPVLFLANVVSAGLWTTALLGQRANPELMPALFTVAPLTPLQHAQLALKSFIVACSWVATYFAVKHLPVSIASPIRAMAPVCTLFGALLVLGERPTWLELVGVGITIAAFVGLSFAGQREGI